MTNLGYGPYTEEQAEEITRKFTEALARLVTAKWSGYHVDRPYASGNVREGETGWCFDVSDGTHQFNVEVYGPLAEAVEARQFVRGPVTHKAGDAALRYRRRVAESSPASTPQQGRNST